MKLLAFSVARAEGKTRYFTGDACPRGHIAERIVSTRACVACAAEKKQAWLTANPEKANAQKRAWRDKNIEKARALNLASQKLHRESANERQRRWLSENREQANAASAAWAKANPGKCTARSARRRAAELQRTPAWADNDVINSLYELARIYREAGHDVEIDHIVPLQGKKVSGLHVQDNLQVICSMLNKSKSNNFAVR
jgi:hypothetical protein